MFNNVHDPSTDKDELNELHGENTANMIGDDFVQT